MQKHSFLLGGVLSKKSSGKPAFLHALFLENEKQNSTKNYGQLYFPVKSKATCKNAAHLDTKKATKVT